MKRVMAVLVAAMAVVLAGCTHPPVIRPPATEPGGALQGTQGTGAGSTGTETTTTQVRPWPGDGTATPTEIARATGGESIPEAKPTDGEEFVDPGSISREVGATFQSIYFDYDNSVIRTDAQARLHEIGAYLLAHPAVKVRIEGNCDERGTREYNLVLGEQRALAARKFLVAVGVSPARLFTATYGEDRPADTGHDEAAWSKNRRCDFKVSAVGHG